MDATLTWLRHVAWKDLDKDKEIEPEGPVHAVGEAGGFYAYAAAQWCADRGE